MEKALAQVKALWDRTAPAPLDTDRGTLQTPSGDLLRCVISGTPVFFDPVIHVYRGPDGQKWTGGSTFANKFKGKFAGRVIAGKMGDKHGADPDRIQAMWKLNAEASSTFGTAVHAALQLRGEYAELSRQVKDGSVESATTSNPVLRPIVESFFSDFHAEEKAFYEAFVADPRTRSCGLIDRLVVEDDGLVVEDFKTNASVEKDETILPPFKGVVPNNSLGVYWLQLSYYAHILMAHGRTVKGLRVHHWTGTEWMTYEHPVVDLTVTEPFGEK